MTQAEMEAAWVRWMHRNDVQADLDTVWTLTTAVIAERWMHDEMPYPTADEWLAQAPRMFLHAGLMHLHELAQDDDGQAREMERFEAAVQDAHIRWSLSNTNPDMLAQGVQ